MCRDTQSNCFQPPNSALKLTVRPRISRRPSRLPRLEFARRRATCTGIIGCAASGAPLDAGRRPAARNLTSGRWADWRRRALSWAYTLAVNDATIVTALAGLSGVAIGAARHHYYGRTLQQDEHFRE